MIQTQTIENKTADKNAMLAGSYIVTVDDYDTYQNPRLIDRSVFNDFAFKNGSFSESAQLNPDEYGTTYKIPQYPLDFLAGLLNLNTYHEECCDLVSTYLTKYGFDIKARKGSKEELDVQIRDDILDWFYNMPVPIETIISESGYDYEAIGVAGIELMRENTPEHLPQHFRRFDIIHSKLHTDNIRVLQEVNGKRRFFLLYGYNQSLPESERVDVDKYNGNIYPYGSLSFERRASEVIWLTKYKTGTNNYGSAKISKCLDVIETEIGRSSFNRKFFQNYGLPAFVVTVTGNFNDYESERYLPDGTLNPDFDETKTLKYIVGEQIKQMILNPYSAMVITIPTSSNFESDVKIDITPLNNDVKEASFRLLREDNKNEICAAHGMSSDIVGTTQTGNLGGTSLETDLSSFATNKIKPIQRIFEQAITNVITERYEESGYRFLLINNKGEDKDKKLERILKLGNAGLMTRKEQQIALSSEFGITINEDNKYLDEYLINGRTEEQLFEYGISPNSRYGSYYNTSYYNDGSIATKALEGLEQDLLMEAFNLWCENGADNTISIKSEAEKRLPENIKRIIRRRFTNRE